MPLQLSKATASARSLLAGFTSGQKAVTGIALVALLVGGFFFTSWASKPSLVPVFTNLEPADAAAITEELTTRGTQYELAEGGATVMVPKKDVYQLRLDLSAAGLPEGGKAGYEILDDVGITTSDEQQRINYQRALEGELSKTISSIEGVEATTVHLVMPEESLFSGDARQPSASVLVKMKAGKDFDAGQVQAVVNLVSSSVEGLSPERVSLADSKGRQLSSPVEGGISAAVGDLRTTQTARFEDNLENSVQEMLSAVVGSGKAVVRVNAELDFDKKDTVIEEFNPNDKQPQAVNKATEVEKYVGADQIVGGILGPENVDTDLGDGENTYEKSKENVILAVDKVTTTATAAPGSVKRLGVAVIMDTGAAGTVSPEAIKQLVTAATGASAERGDIVEVDRMAFDDSAAKAAEEEFAQIAAAEAGAKRMSLIRTGVVLFVVLLLVLYALRIMRRDRRTPVELPYEVDVTQAALEAERIAALAAAERLALEPAMSGAEVKRLEIKGEIGELVERQPEEVAQLLRGWLADRRS